MVDGLRIRFDWRRGLVDPLLEASLRRAVVGGVVGKLVDVRGAVARHDGDRFRWDALGLLEQVRINAHLDDGCGLDPLGQLCVGDVVAVLAEHGRPIVAPEQEVRVAAPAAVEERSLEDHVGARPHRLDGLVVGGAQLGRRGGDASRHLDDGPAGRLELGDVQALVSVTALLQELELRVVAERLLDLAARTRQLERDEVVALEEADEVRGADDQRAVDQLHRSQPYRSAMSACLSRRDYDSAMVAKRRDSEGKFSVGPTWEGLVERQIREAMDEGAFDELPYSGERLPIEDDSAAGERALGFRVLRNAGVAPPWIEADKEVRELLAAQDVLLARAAAARTSPLARARLRGAFERVVAEANRAIERLNAEAPTDRQHRRPLDPEAELARLEAAFRS